MRPAKGSEWHFVQYNATAERWQRRRAVIPLSPADQELLKSLAAGLSAVEISKRIHRSESVTSGRISSLCQRMGVPNKHHLAIAAEQLYGPKVSGALIDALDLSMLTDREIEVLMLAAEGMKYAEVGNRLGVGSDCIWAHMARIKAKSGISSLGKLLVAARKSLQLA
jgi:DNA-binding CsgD family transcriptional regulator